MLRISNTLLFVLFCTVAFCQKSIIFFEGNWEEALAKAKEEQKLLFVDAYATWCKPCKMMEKEVFTKENIATFYNENFISYKLDVDTKEGNNIADYYKVKGMPTFLFVDSEKNLRYQGEGYISQEAFMQLAQNALNPKKQYKIKKKKR